MFNLEGNNLKLESGGGGICFWYLKDFSSVKGKLVDADLISLKS